jgi:nitronate monooxygenase
LEAALASRPDLVALSFGDPSPWIGRCRDAGVRVACQTQTYADVERAVGAGADLLVAQDNEAGGHTGKTGLLPLLSGMVENDPDVPVLAAGGIGDGTTLASALMAGAEGAWLGTSLLATPEAVEIDDHYKSFIVASDGSDTVFTRAYDILSPFRWPENIGERVRRNPFTDRWIDREAELEERRSEVAQARAEALNDPTRR